MGISSEGFEGRIGAPPPAHHPTFDAGERREPSDRVLRRTTEGGGSLGREEPDRRLRLLLVVALLSILVGGTIDLLLDRPSNWLSFHPIFETVMVAGALVMATTLWLGWWHAAREEASLRGSLAAQREERDRWRSRARSALEGFGAAIDAQLREWRLTPAEREVALLLLEGRGHKEIAAATGRSERTVRQHAVAVYGKAGVAGRAELSAWFLRDLLLPDAQREVMRSSAGRGTAAP